MTRVRKTLAMFLATLVLAACSAQPSHDENIQGVADAAVPTPELYAPELEPQVVLPSPEEYRVAPSLTVRTEASARIYTGRGQWYLLVAEVPAGTELEYVDSREGWLQVRTTGGEVGWLNGSGAVIDDGRGQAVRYQIAPGRWEIQTDSDVSIEVRRISTGVIQLAISGLTARPEIVELAGGSLLIAGAMSNSIESALEIGDSGLAGLSLSEHGILADLEARPYYRVMEAQGDQFTVEFRPGLERVERTANGWSLHMRGDLRPVLRVEGENLVVDLPGAVLTPEFAGSPAGTAMTEVEPESAPGGALQLSSLSAAVPSRMPAGGLRLQLPKPDSPYALYRTGDGSLELRILPPGLKGKTIVLDPGHGGPETGAVGVAGYLEKDINLAVALLLQPMLEELGANVVMTRTADSRVIPQEVADSLRSHSERTQADLAARSAMANRLGADMVVSIHANGGGPADRGIETFWTVANMNASRSLYLAELMQEELLNALGLVDRGVKQRPFNVIRYSEAPAVLVELGFMTNASEEQLLASPAGQRASAEALLKAIVAYFGE